MAAPAVRVIGPPRPTAYRRFPSADAARGAPTRHLRRAGVRHPSAWHRLGREPRHSSACGEPVTSPHGGFASGEGGGPSGQRARGTNGLQSGLFLTDRVGGRRQAGEPPGGHRDGARCPPCRRWTALARCRARHWPPTTRAPPWPAHPARKNIPRRPADRPSAAPGRRTPTARCSPASSTPPLFAAVCRALVAPLVCRAGSSPGRPPAAPPRPPLVGPDLPPADRRRSPAAARPAPPLPGLARVVADRRRPRAVPPCASATGPLSCDRVFAARPWPRPSGPGSAARGRCAACGYGRALLAVRSPCTVPLPGAPLMGPRALRLPATHPCHGRLKPAPASFVPGRMPRRAATEALFSYSYGERTCSTG